MMPYPQSLDALSLLQQRISQQQQPQAAAPSQAELEWMARALRPKVAPPGLPPAVTQSIQNLPSYQEGQVIPKAGPGSMSYENFAPDLQMQLTNPTERERLADELNAYRTFPGANIPTPEGQVLRPPSLQTSPYNTNLGFPWALY